jgi:hypothetical protein
VVVIVTNGVVDFAQQQVIGARDFFWLLPGAIEQDNMADTGARSINRWLAAQNIGVSLLMTARLMSLICSHGA